MFHSRLLSYSSNDISDSQKNLDSRFYKLVNYIYFKQSEFTDYSRFLLDLRFKKIRGKELFLPLEFKQYNKTDNIALIKRDTFLELPYNRKLIDNYLIRSYAIALLEFNINPIDVRKKEVALASEEYKESVYRKKITRNIVIDTTYLPSTALKIFPYMELYRVKVIHFLKKYVKESHGLLNDSDIKNSIDFNDARYDIIEALFQSIPLYNTDEKPQLLDLVAKFAKFFYSTRIFKYVDRSKNRSQKYKQDKLEFKGTYIEFINHLTSSNFSSSYSNIVLTFFNLNLNFVYETYNYDMKANRKTVYKKFLRDIHWLFYSAKIKKNDVVYINKVHKINFKLKDFKYIFKSKLINFWN